jgi:hypothetical protein
LGEIKRVFIPLFSEEDHFLIQYGQKLISNSESQITLFDAVGKIKNQPATKEAIRAIEQTAPNHITLMNERILDPEFLKSQQMMIISMESWKKLVDSKSIWLADIPSTLIVMDQ